MQRLVVGDHSSVDHDDADPAIGNIELQVDVFALPVGRQGNVGFQVPARGLKRQRCRLIGPIVVVKPPTLAQIA